MDKDEYYLGIARSVAQKSPCLRKRFGAVIVVNDAIVSTGYNGPARGVVHCNEIGKCLKNIKNIPHFSGYDYCIAVHAEENAVINAARNGGKIMGGILYIHGETLNGKLTPSRPCYRCKRVLINAGIKNVITRDVNGKIIKYRVEDWIDEDSQSYIKSVGSK